MEKDKRADVKRRLDEAKAEVRRRQADIRKLEKSLQQMDEKQNSELVKRHRISPADLKEMLDEKEKENQKIIKEESAK